MEFGILTFNIQYENILGNCPKFGGVSNQLTELYVIRTVSYPNILLLRIY